ncbi:hypothetical protein ASPZODRAFT_144413 [Penicilliopsis zonata CBS 506.65]|uniref:Uncharacterized protein n=1 Tax=Penicilliopsis zonata CBS 506.65 TaxID=1073090 RepID=A0A1L9SD63_9EURO|nr:hypothetical protein ASPZODRAFT_144413 [Penicilliopsis zonata CBS 506.65]OJJ45109.1 hypothetical protein ASPZODRAFT_144413 [Penicilliopsis zonata CBS 506.65]
MRLGAGIVAGLVPALALASKSRLKAAVHPEMDTTDLARLESNGSASLFYVKNGKLSEGTQLAAHLEAEFHHHTVILDHSAAIANVSCYTNHMMVTFTGQKAFDRAQSNWTRDDELILVSSQSGCHPLHEGQYGYFNATSISFTSKNLTAIATGSQSSVRDAVNVYNLSWGNYTSSSNTTSSTASAASTSASASAAAVKRATTCGALPATIPSNLPQLIKSLGCGTGFDAAMDDYLTYIGDDSNLDAALAAFAPGVSGLTVEAYEAATGTTLRKRGWFSDVCDWVDDNIVEPVVDAVVDVVETVVEVVEVLSEAAEEAVEAIKEAAEAILPSWSPSVSFTIPVDMSAPSAMLDDSPWGDAYQIWSFEDGESDVNYGINAETLAKLTGADELIVFDIDGVTQMPNPGVQLYCVDCYVTGSFTVTGSVTYTLLVGFTEMSLDLAGSLKASIQLGLNAYAEYEDDIASVRLLTIPIDGFDIPEIIDVGPAITLDVDATVEIDALGQVLAGAILEWSNMGAHLDVYDILDTTGHGFAPQVTPVFNASGQLNATASVGIPVGFGIEIDILDGEWTKEIALVDRPALELVAIYTVDVDTSGVTVDTDGCDGIYWYVNFINELMFELLDEDHEYDIGTWEGPAFLSGCIGDNGQSWVSESQEPTADDETLAGCTLVNDLITNNGFDTITDSEVLPWRNTQSSGTYMYVEEDDYTSSAPYSMRFYASDMDDTQTYTGTVLQQVTACTDAQYDVTFTARVVDCGTGVCELTSITVWSDTNAELDVSVYPNLYIAAETGTQQMNTYGPYDFTIPSFNNDASESVYVGITFTAQYTQSWDIRIDDVHVKPDGSDYSNKKRDDVAEEGDGRSGTLVRRHVGELDVNRRVYEGNTPVERSHIKRDSSVDAIPVIASGTAIPAIGVETAAPAIGDFYSTAIPTLTGAGAAPAVTADYAAPSLAYVSEAVTGTVAATADPTAVASLIGPCNYDFPASSVLMASATVGSYPMLPTSGATTDTDGYTQLPDLSGTVQLAAADDGNLYLSPYPGTEPETLFFSKGSVILQDTSSRSFHYYPDTMDAYGVSRLRIADLADTPLTAQLITLVPFSTSAGTAYAALDTLGQVFVLSWCNAADWLGAKVFLTRDYSTTLETLASADVQWIVTGDEVTECYPLLLTSDAATF